MKTRRIFTGRRVACLLVVVALIITGSVWAQNTGTSSVNIAAGGVSGKLATVTSASSSTQFLRFGDYEDGDPKYTAPDWIKPGGTLGGIQSPGDLFYIDTSGNPGDVRVEVFVTNMPDIAKQYKHLLVQLNFYKLATATSQRIGTGDGSRQYFYTASFPVVPFSETVYVAGTARTRNIHYTINYSKGDIKFTDGNKPAVNAAITITYQYWTQATWLGSNVAVSNESVGTGDGAHQNFDLDHARVIPDSETVYVGGVLQNRGKTADYEMDYDNGMVKFNASSKPANGAAITASYKYYTEAAFKGDSTLVRDEAVGTGDSKEKRFDLDRASIVSGSETIYVAGVAKTRDTDYTIDYERGTIDFETAPANGAAITADYRYWTVQESGLHVCGTGKLLGRPLGYTTFILEGNTKYDLAVTDAQFHGQNKGYQGGSDAPSFFIQVRAR